MTTVNKMNMEVICLNCYWIGLAYDLIPKATSETKIGVKCCPNCGSQDTDHFRAEINEREDNFDDDDNEDEA